MCLPLDDVVDDGDSGGGGRLKSSAPIELRGSLLLLLQQPKWLPAAKVAELLPMLLLPTRLAEPEQ